MSEQTETTSSEEREGTQLVVRVAQLTDVGRVRTENQDFMILSTPEDEVDLGKGRLMVVADGMGGHRGGATASRMAATIIKDEFYKDPDKDLVTSLERTLQKANARIFAESQANPDLRGMGTTCSALVVRDGSAYLGHVGDSRIYRVRKGEIVQLTDDHSLVASMVREGLLTPEEAEVHPRRNVLQRSMGVGPDVEIDAEGGIEIELGDVYILCSDGLHGLVRNPEILEIASMDIEDAAKEYVKRSLDRGAPDNVTVVVGRVEESSVEEIEKEEAEAREARRMTLETLSHPTEEISMADVAEAEKDFSDSPTLKIAPLTDDADEDDGEDAAPEPASDDAGEASGEDENAPAEDEDESAEDEDESAELMEDEGGLGWIVALVIIAALVGALAYFLVK